MGICLCVVTNLAKFGDISDCVTINCGKSCDVSFSLWTIEEKLKFVPVCNEIDICQMDEKI